MCAHGTHSLSLCSQSEGDMLHRGKHYHFHADGFLPKEQRTIWYLTWSLPPATPVFVNALYQYSMYFETKLHTKNVFHLRAHVLKWKRTPRIRKSWGSFEAPTAAIIASAQSPNGPCSACTNTDNRSRNINNKGHIVVSTIPCRSLRHHAVTLYP
mmetsp:Transcript_24445/g.68130  ORF Transcript_24445/g.68130 Transcript_24445/m.68130 type:complete len:155 (-) Transcript_24445:228-692(-)